MLQIQGFNGQKVNYNTLGTSTLLSAPRLSLAAKLVRMQGKAVATVMHQLALAANGERLVVAATSADLVVRLYNGALLVRRGSRTVTPGQGITAQLSANGKALTVSVNNAVTGPLTLRVTLNTLKPTGQRYLNAYVTLQRQPTRALGGVLGATIRPAPSRAAGQRGKAAGAAAEPMTASIVL